MFVSILGVLAIAAVHAFTHRLRVLDGTPRSRWLSVSAGMSVAYVVLHLLPELAEHQSVLAETGWTAQVHHAVYLLTLAGLLTFYGFERASRSHQDRKQMSGEEGDTSAGKPAADYGPKGSPDAARSVYRLHLALFSIYSLLVGYVLSADRYEGRDALLFAIAMAVHFVVVDKGLYETFERGWTHLGRWVMVAALTLGWAVGLISEIPHTVLGGVSAFLGGAVVLNVLKEELPEERESRFGAFVGGAAGYALLLIWL
jgi:zinc transporter ZupT